MLHITRVTRDMHIKRGIAERIEKEGGARNTSDIDRLILYYFTQLTEDLFTTLSNVFTGDKKFTTADLSDVRFVV